MLRSILVPLRRTPRLGDTGRGSRLRGIWHTVGVSWLGNQRLPRRARLCKLPEGDPPPNLTVRDHFPAKYPQQRCSYSLDTNACPGCDLSGADLSQAILKEADLRAANLSEAKLPNADLVFADLRVADLSDADLQGANLTSADLSMADLTGANLRNAILTGATLSNTIGIIADRY